MVNLYDLPSVPAGGEAETILCERGGVSVRRIVSNLARTEWYDQEEDEWLVLLEGRAELETEDGTVSLAKGDTLLLRAHCRHRVVSTSENALWLTVHIVTDQQTERKA